MRIAHSTSLSEQWKKLAMTSVELGEEQREQEGEHGRARRRALGTVAGAVEQVVELVVLGHLALDAPATA